MEGGGWERWVEVKEQRWRGRRRSSSSELLLLVGVAPLGRRRSSSSASFLFVGVAPLRRRRIEPLFRRDTYRKGGVEEGKEGLEEEGEE